jgi:hypothetical protein
MQVVGSVLYGADEVVSALVASRIPHVGEKGFGPCAALGVVRSGLLLGGVVFHNYHGHIVEMSGAFDRADWIRPSTLRRLFSYPFIQLGCANMVTMTPKNNERARKMDEFLGFRVVGKLTKGADGITDMMIYEMPRNTCRWLKERDNG